MATQCDRLRQVFSSEDHGGEGELRETQFDKDPNRRAYVSALGLPSGRSAFARRADDVTAP